MPKTSLFKVEIMIVKEYFEHLYGNDYEEYDDDYMDGIWIDPSEFIKPGMTFMMNYTHTRFYKSEEASTIVTVESIPFFIDEEPDIIYIKLILKTDTPIYICERDAMLGRSITLHTEETTIAKGGVEKILDWHV
jgi:hypothetical protein